MASTDNDDINPEESRPSSVTAKGRLKHPTETDRSKAQPEPTPTKSDLFEWLEKLFYSAPELAHFPDKIEVSVLRGKDLEMIGAQINLYGFGPSQEHKPTRTRLVEIANEICFLTQRDCDIQRKSVVYGVLAWDFHLKDKPIGGFKIRCQPRDEHRLGGSPRSDDSDEDDDDAPMGKRLIALGLEHSRETFNMYAGGLEAILTRYDSLVKQQDSRIAQQDERIAKQQDMLERALSLEADREEKRAMTKLKMTAAERGIDVATAVAPALINNLFGRNVLPAHEPIEVQTLKKFFSSLTKDQIEKVFGDVDENGKPTKTGVLTFQQGQLLADVASGKRPVDDLDMLLPDAGPFAITKDQLGKLMTSCGLDVEVQLLPLKIVIDNRTKKK